MFYFKYTSFRMCLCVCTYKYTLLFYELDCIRMISPIVVFIDGGLGSDVS